MTVEPVQWCDNMGVRRFYRIREHRNNRIRVRKCTANTSPRTDRVHNCTVTVRYFA